MTPLESLIATGTKLWLDSVDPKLVVENRAFGATGATSNPIIVSDIIKSGAFDDQIAALTKEGLDDEAIAWKLTDSLVREAQKVFAEVNKETKGNDGYVSFELDVLLGAVGHTNRMIKVPATPGGLAALEELAAAGITLNVTLIFSADQYHTAREAVWKGAQRRKDPKTLKSVYSIFVSRIDVYTAKHAPTLTPEAQGLVGIVNAQRIWKENQEWWKDKNLPLQQEIIFASTGTKDPKDPPEKYVAALAGSDIQTNPPGTNAAIQKLPGKTFTRKVDQLPPANVLADIDAKVDFAHMEKTLMEEGLKKFADPHKALIALIKSKRT